MINNIFYINLIKKETKTTDLCKNMVFSIEVPKADGAVENYIDFEIYDDSGSLSVSYKKEYT